MLFLNFIMTHWLYTHFPEASEGELSHMRAHLVKGDMLAKIAMEIDLGAYLYLGSGELKNGGHQRKTILADAFEALIAAIYQDSDLATCQAVVLKLFSKQLDLKILMQQTKDPKSQLQELLQAKHFALPEYRIERVDGEAHAQVFHVQCLVSALNKTTQGCGSSRRRAEQMAAAAFYDAIDR